MESIIVRSQRGLCAALLGVVIGSSGIAAAPLQAQETTPIQKATTWLLSQKKADGSFGGFGIGSTVDAVLGLAAIGIDPDAATLGEPTPVDYLLTVAPSYARTNDNKTRVGATGKLLMVAEATRLSPRSFGGLDLIALLNNEYDSATGMYGATSGTLDQAYAILGLSATHQLIPPAAVSALVAMQKSDGGWGFSADASSTSDTNSTAVVLQALAAVGQGQSEAATKGVTYLTNLQQANGGFPYDSTGASDPNSTAYVIQGLVAVGKDPLTLTKGSNTPLSALLSYQNADGSLGSDFAVATTIQAIPALALKSFPVRVPIQLYMPYIARSA